MLHERSLICYIPYHHLEFAMFFSMLLSSVSNFEACKVLLYVMNFFPALEECKVFYMLHSLSIFEDTF